MEKNYEIVSWDTNFFGFKVARLQANIIEKDNGSEQLKDMYSNEVKLAYYVGKSPLNENILNNDFFNIHLVITRVPIVKDLSAIDYSHDKIFSYPVSYPDEELIKLSQLAGAQGRFGKDPNISEQECNDIFKNWIINSVNREMASDVLVYKEDGKIVGFSTLQVGNGIGYAPLFAVAREYEGKGISFALMKAAESVMFAKGVTKVLSGTQNLNKKALAIYKRYGFEIKEPEYVYHFWRK
ncbi:hypothetical protein JM79_1312 [Gramella sp. Hel_I_59]|uniref:GNAT family N-acetyltransferase n=1 Tax=Gramella sp. Hel_I_59 TaxID=1249978 RepID=UPI0011509D51|nr:GNAT family N-acetyltransferase [Gramella sp. Hel_I_59]TQI70402.1 hypothetical protein JM79_1312 [Gramella sp. Hel_I_59]